MTRNSETRLNGAAYPCNHDGFRPARRLSLGAFLLAVVAMAFLLPCCSYAQLNTGSLQGVVADATGAAIPGAIMTVRNSETGVARSTVTGGAGEFTAASLAPGIYTVTVAHPGFKSMKLENVKVNVGESASLNIVVPVGEVSQMVEVATNSSSIGNTDSTLGTVIEQQQVVDLPLNGRQFSQLIQLAPGVVPIDNSQNAGKAPNFGAGAASPAVNGQTNRSNIFYVDGMIDSNPFFGGFSFSPSVDDIQEFKAESHTDQAEFGQATGAIVSVITRPGTNAFHGAAFEFVRNTIFNSQIKNFSSLPQAKLPYHQNQFGGEVGGPILKNKVFFFANYEGGRQVSGHPQNFIVPTAAERSGDFSGVLPGGVAPIIYDPTTYNPVTQTEQQFTFNGKANVIPTSRLDAGMLAYLNGIYPLPTTPAPNGGSNLYTTTSDRTVGDQGSVRGDYTLGSNNTFIGRYSQNHASVVQPSAMLNLFTTGFNGKNTGGSWLHTYSSTLASQVTVAYNTLNIPQQMVIPVSQTALYAAAGLGAGFSKNPGMTPFDVVPYFNLNGGNYSGFWNGAGPIGPMAITQADASVSKVVAKHTLKFGGSFYHTAMYTNWSQNGIDFSNRGTWNAACQFATAPTPACPTYNAKAGDLGAGGDPVASMLLSVPQGANRALGNTGVNLRQNTTSFFGQDTWQASAKWTVTYGLRWDYSSPVTETDNRLAVYNIYTHKYQIAQGNKDLPSGPLPANVVIGPSNSNTEKHFTYFQPRIGIAYAITPKTTFRAGIGRSFDVWGLPLQVAQQNRGAWPSGFAQIASTQQLNIAGLDKKPDGTLYTAQNPFTGTAVLPASPFPQGGVGFQDVKWQPASSFQWNGQVQQEFGKFGTLQIAYVGSETEHQTINLPYDVAPASPSSNKVFPDQIFGSAGNDYVSAGTASYQSLQTQLSRAYSNGFVYNLTFTYSKSKALAICGTDFNVCVQDPANLSADRGPTNLDIPFVTTFNTAYQLPFGHGKPYLTSGPGAVIAGGWQVNSIITARSGQVLNPGNGQNGDRANAGGGTQRINFVGDPNAGAPHTIDAWFNAAAFVQPANGTYGTAGLNSLRGPGFWNTDFSLFRDIPIHERLKFQFRTEVFNLFNHPNLNNPNANLGGSFFNQITGSSSPRVIQLAGKILF